MFRLLWQELIFRRNSILWWSLGLCFFPLVYVAIYPSVAAEMEGLADLEIYQAMGMSLGTFPDWIGSILILFMPLVAAIYALLNSTGTLAGEEEDGRLETMVTLPVRRWQIVTAKALALVISSAIMFLVVAIVSILVFLAIQGQIETDVVGMDLFFSVLAGWPIVFAMAMIGLFLAALCPTRRLAGSITAAILIVSYFGSNLAASSPALETIEPIFLFTYLDSTGRAVIEGQQMNDVLVLVGIGVVAFLLALILFQRRDLTVGIWPWQQGKVPASQP